MDQIKPLIEAYSRVLHPVFRTTCTILGLTMLWVGFSALSQPTFFAENFGLPLVSSRNDTRPHSNDKPSLSPNGNPQTGTAWLITFAGREVALGTVILLLLYLDELRALSVVLLAMYWVAAGDTIATLRFGKKGSVKNHFIPSVFMAFLGPLGLLLHATT